MSRQKNTQDEGLRRYVAALETNGVVMDFSPQALDENAARRNALALLVQLRERYALLTEMPGQRVHPGELLVHMRSLAFVTQDLYKAAGDEPQAQKIETLLMVLNSAFGTELARVGVEVTEDGS
jgi:hypothetical protein